MKLSPNSNVPTLSPAVTTKLPASIPSPEARRSPPVTFKKVSSPKLKISSLAALLPAQNFSVSGMTSLLRSLKRSKTLKKRNPRCLLLFGFSTLIKVQKSACYLVLLVPLLLSKRARMIRRKLKLDLTYKVLRGRNPVAIHSGL